MNAAPNKFILILSVVLTTCSSCSKPDAEKFFNAGGYKFISGDNTGALADFNKAIQIDPNYVKAYSNRGLVKDALKDEAGAIADYNKAIELDPKYQFAYYNRANAEVNLKKYTNAIADYNEAIGAFLNQ
jgi:tetratricopeptide (TPR) repeat protein